MKVKLKFLQSGEKPCGEFTAEGINPRNLYAKIDQLLHEHRAKYCLVCDLEGVELFMHTRKDKEKFKKHRR